MRHILSLLLTVVVATILAACTNTKPQETMNDKKILVLYYSQTHATEQMAQYIQRQLNADIASIELTDPYDPDYDSTIARGKRELDNKEWPELKPLNVKVDDYDIVFLGFPVWFGTYANPIASLLEQVDFNGKQVVPFATFGSGGLRSSIAHLKEVAPKAEILGSIGCRRALMDQLMTDEVDRVLVILGLIDGKAEEPLPYSEQKAVTAADKEIFVKAVGDYPMLKARPLTCGTREVKEGTKYFFVAENSFGGQTSNVEIYVTAPKNADPYFTLVEH